MPKDKRAVGHIKKISENKYLLRLSCGFDEFGKRIQPSKVVQCTSDTEAEKALIDFYNQRELLAQQGNGTPQTLKQLYDEWITNHIQRDCAPSTETFYTDLWNGYIADKGRAKLKAITPKSIFSILDRIEYPRTKNAVYKMLKAMFNKGIKWGYMTSNPCDRIDTPKYKSGEKKPLAEDEISLAMEHIGEEETKYQAMFYFAALCGMRRQEILALQWSDIDFPNDRFYIRRAATEIRGSGTTTKDTKTEKSARVLFLPAPLKQSLLLHMNEQAKQKNKLGDKWQGGDWIFTQWNGKLMSLQTPSHWWREFAERIGVEGVTFHGLRHTAASYMIKNNVPITTVSGVLGHSNTSTTLNIYSHMIESTKKGAIDILTGVFAPAENEDGKKVILER